MKKLFLFCFITCFCVMASAQKVYFLYLQSDDQTPFYVKMGDKIHSSATSGYLVFPNLTDSTYTFGLGFAKSTAAEAKFSVRINQDDKGYIIKNLDDGLALFDIQDLSLVKANAVPTDNTVYETKTDRFSSILSKAANDPGLLKVPVAKKEEPVTAKAAEKEVVRAGMEESKPIEQPVITSATLTRSDTLVSSSEVVAGIIKEENIKKQEDSSAGTDLTQALAKETSNNEVRPLVQEEKKEEVVGGEATEPQGIVYRPSTVSRYSESSTTEGFGIVYFDKKEAGTDTIRILIPASKLRLVTEAETASANEAPLQFEKIDESAAVNKKEPEVVAKSETPAATVVSTTSCRNIATEKDFLKLRRKMASRNTEDAMLDDARKEFRDKCYSVEQVRYLSTLFLSSATKYQFFDAAYNYVADKTNFSSLGSEIKDEHYTKRFKAIIGE